MAKVATLQGSFNSGEFSPLLYGRPDEPRYKAGLAICENMIPMVQGGLTRRGGTKFIAARKDTLFSTRLFPFKYSITQNYIIEIGSGYARFYTNYAQIQTAPGVAYEIVSPYAANDIENVKFTQSGDVMYFVHPKYPPYKLERLSATNFKFVQIQFKDGPYLDIHVSTSTAASVVTVLDSHERLQLVVNTPAGGTLANINAAVVSISNVTAGPGGEIKVQSNIGTNSISPGDIITIAGVLGTVEANGTWTVDSSSPVVGGNLFTLANSAFVNAYTGGGTYLPNMFDVGMVGQPLRFILAEAGDFSWHYVTITEIIAPWSINVLINTGDNFVAGNAPFENPIQEYRLPYWGDSYPSCIVFHEDRLVFAGAASPERIDGSSTGDYENFSPSNVDGSVVDSNAYSFTLNSNNGEINAIRWMTSDEQGMPIGTTGGAAILRPSILNEALTASNVLARPITTLGSADTQAIVADKSSIYIDRSTRKVREMRYFYDIGGFKSSDLTELSEHISSDGISTELTFAKVPQQIVWTGRNDGTLLGMTFDRNLDALRAGWHRHLIGGRSDTSGSLPRIISITSIASPDGTQDDVWLLVQRYINGAPVYYIEYMTRIFQDFDLQENAFFVDCGNTFDNPKSIAAITNANPGVITSAAHGFANGDKVVFRGLKGMGELNYNKYLAVVLDANTFTLTDFDGNPINTTAFSPYVFEGTVRKLIITITGISWLEGETVSILADGAPQADKIVTGGAIVLDSPAATVQFGYNFKSTIQTLRIDAGATNGTSMGKLRRTNKVALMLHRTLGLFIGTDLNTMDNVDFPNAEAQLGLANPLFSGVLRNILIAANDDTENQIYIQQNQPLPFTLLGIMPQIEVKDEI